MIRVDGIEQALKNIDTQIAGVKNKSQAAFWEVGLKVLNKAMRNLKDSVVTGNLRASGYARPAQGNAVRPDSTELKNDKNESIPGDRIGDLGVEVGFTAIYALNVHENMQARTPKFLERPVVSGQDEIVRIIKTRTGGQ